MSQDPGQRQMGRPQGVRADRARAGGRVGSLTSSSGQRVGGGTPGGAPQFASTLFLTRRGAPSILRLRSADRSSPIIFVMRHNVLARSYRAVGPLTLRAVARAPTAPGAPDTTPAPASQSDPRAVERTAAPEQSAADSSGDRVVPVVARETTPDRTRRESVPARVREVREQMEEAYQAGLEAYQAGRFDEAKEHFDRAVDLVLSSDINLEEQPAFKKAFDEIVRNISDMDADLYSRDSEPTGQDERSPLDELKDITTYLPPEEAEKERQKIQQVVGKISYDIPVVLNPRVLAYIEAFQTRLRDDFEAGLKRSGAYLPMIKKIFREEGLPEDLAYMAHQESAFKLNAYSRARAKGMWQFMSFTGRKYGLRMDLWVDERGDFEKATRAAATYLKELYTRYGDWYLAMAAYNAGEGKIDRALGRSRAKDYWTLTKTRYIRTETKWYVAAILASILIDKSPQDYGFFVDTDPELRWDSVTVDRATDLQVIAAAAGSTLETLRGLNPELRGLVTPPNRDSYVLRVPDGAEDDVVAALQTLPNEQRVSWTLHEVRPGETLQRIAAKYRTTVANLKRWNNLGGAAIRPGQRLIAYYGERGSGPREDQDVPNAAVSVSGGRLEYKVQMGDTLATIALKFGVSSDDLCRWNNLPPDAILRPGDRVLVGETEAPSGIPGSGSGTKSGREGLIRHRVKAGETLHRIARLYDVTVSQVRAWNRLASNTIYPGQVLTIRGL